MATDLLIDVSMVALRWPKTWIFRLQRQQPWARGVTDAAASQLSQAGICDRILMSQLALNKSYAGDPTWEGGMNIQRTKKHRSFELVASRIGCSMHVCIVCTLAVMHAHGKAHGHICRGTEGPRDSARDGRSRNSRRTCIMIQLVSYKTLHLEVSSERDFESL